MQEVWDFIRGKMAKSQQTQIKIANKHKKTSLEYRIDDLVWLSTKNIHTKRPSKKLNHMKISLYQVIKLVKLLYQLELLKSIKISNVFYPSLLRITAKNQLLRQQNDPCLQ